MTRAELLKTAKPILFSMEMVQAILAGRKTQTRQVVKKKYDNTVFDWYENKKYGEPVFCEAEPKTPHEKLPDRTTRHKIRFFEECIPRYRKGDILYVRETWGVGIQLAGGIIYKANYTDKTAPLADGEKWKSPTHMPKEAARIFLRVTGVRVERLCDISDVDCIAEGINLPI